VAPSDFGLIAALALTALGSFVDGMAKASKFLLPLTALVCAIGFFVIDTSDAFAQSQNCAALSNSLRNLERSGDFGDLDSINGQTRQAKQDVQQAESQYVRDGCNAAAKAGQPLNAQCRAEARQVLSARAALKQVSQQADTGNAVAQQREAILQEMARFNCNSRASSSPQQASRGNLFDQLFGAFESDQNNDDGVSTRGEDWSGDSGYHTVRTVCVRKSDGYYWPISYATLIDYAANDLQACLEQCPGVDVDLYYYDNPGQEPDQMINLQGVAYKSLPTAFAYRTKYDPTNTCKPAVSYGSVNLAALPDGTSRAMVTYGTLSFPLPMRDPRRPMEVTVMPVASKDFVDIPLPRPRPAAPGEAPKPVVVKQAATSDAERIVMFGDKRVRIVGPDTPYAPTEGAGT
jgi:Protein of unknown function (DUF2865)